MDGMSLDPTTIRLHLPCVPPSVTAQQKRVSWAGGRPRFFHSERMQAEASTWSVLLVPHRPPAPIAGAVSLTLRFVYPHLRRTARRDQGRQIPKITRPDAGNVAKHFEDTLVRLGFLEDDAQVACLQVEKWHGPAEAVGIDIAIAPFETVCKGGR